ncbi:MAG: pyruvate kinase [Tissierellia bacterium]|nr:pyruvate kinase [Tissierellia bacterium]
MKKTKIVATIGPASDSEAMLTAFAREGVNVFRLNFSHGTHQSHGEVIRRIKEVRKKTGIPVAIMLDTKGPEIRTGDFPQGPVDLREGQEYKFYFAPRPGDGEGVSVSYADLGRDVAVGGTLLVDDGLLEFEIQEIFDDHLTTVVKNNGTIASKKSINVPGAAIRLPALTEKDRADILFGVEQGVDFIAASFIRKAEDVFAIRKLLEEAGGSSIKIIAKIENQEGVAHQRQIIDIADGIMVARGDLGVEIETEAVPIVQKEMIAACMDEGIYAITATQMLDSMMRNPRPTRAEVNDVANAIMDGTSAVMLSGETASGKYPLEAVRSMVRVCEITEEHLDYRRQREMAKRAEATITNVIARNAVDIAEELKVDAIIVSTATGFSARAISKFRPQVPVIGVTTSEKPLREMSLYWNVEGVLAPHVGEDFIEETVGAVLEAGKIRQGDLVVLVAGIPRGLTGSTNLIKVHQVTQILAKGTPIYGERAMGKARIVNDSGSYSRDFHQGDILIAPAYDPDLLPFARRAGGLIFEEGGMTSEGAIIGSSLEKPTIVGAAGATELEHARVITMNGRTGEIVAGDMKAKG